MLLHSYRRAPAADISRSRKQLLQRQRRTFFVSAYLGCFFQIHFSVAGHYANDVPAFVAMKYDCLKDLFYVFTQRLSHMNGTQIVLVYFVGNLLIFYVVVVQKPGDVRFLSFFTFHTRFVLWA